MTEARLKRKVRIRGKIAGTATRPRLSVFRSNKYIYAQLINDDKGATLASAHGDSAEKVGEELAKAALKKKIKTAVFDRGGYRYHGRVQALADAARKGGLVF